MVAHLPEKRRRRLEGHLRRISKIDWWALSPSIHTQAPPLVHLSSLLFSLSLSLRIFFLFFSLGSFILLICNYWKERSCLWRLGQVGCSLVGIRQLRQATPVSIFEIQVCHVSKNFNFLKLAFYLFVNQQNFKLKLK